ncbi:B-cell receptor-associated 31-like, partial [Striga asiatica]
YNNDETPSNHLPSQNTNHRHHTQSNPPNPSHATNRTGRISRRITSGHRALSRRRFLRSRRRHGGRGRRSPEQANGEQDLVHLVHRQLAVGVDGVSHGGIVNAGGDIDLVAGGCDVDLKPAVPCLGPDRVAHRLELGQRETFCWSEIELRVPEGRAEKAASVGANNVIPCPAAVLLSWASIWGPNWVVLRSRIRIFVTLVGPAGAGPGVWATAQVQKSTIRRTESVGNVANLVYARLGGRGE